MILALNQSLSLPLSSSFMMDSAGYNGQLFARPELYELLLSRIPPSKISLGKKVLKVEEKEDKVIIHCSDGSAYRGDILVGADGAYSAVRQNIFRDMKEAGILPKSDSEDLVAGYTCMVGVTDSLDLEKYPMLRSPDCDSEFMGCDSRSVSFPPLLSARYCFALTCPLTVCLFSVVLMQWVLMSIPNGRIAWACSLQFQSLEEAKQQMFMNSEWGPEANAPMIKEFQDLPIPYGGTLSDLFEKTPMERVSKVYLEHKMFQTWHYKRSVLIGDGKFLLFVRDGRSLVLHPRPRL